MASSLSDRCGYRLEIGQADEDLSTEPCNRPVWEDHEHCIWHARVDGKTSDMLENARPGPSETLNGAYLKEASLGGVDWLVNSSLVGATLSDADVNGSDFSNANLTLATLTNLSGRNADFRGATLEGANFTNADLRRANLESALLNEAIFTDVHIGSRTIFGETTIYDHESRQPELGDERPLEAATWVYRELQQLYQENALPDLARQSYYQEKDARRRLAWSESNYAEATKWELSRWVMRYGGSPYRILLVSLLVITIAALLFPLTGGIQEVQDGQAITYTLENPQTAPPWWVGKVMFKSFYFSVVTFATLGYGDIQPIGASARMLASIETILGTLLSALLVFVLARVVTW